jgi:hypothetical protein
MQQLGYGLVSVATLNKIVPLQGSSATCWHWKIGENYGMQQNIKRGEQHP